MENLEAVIHKVILRVARQRSLPLEQIQNHQKLTSELGFKSLDVAKIVAILELELNVDPFAKLVSITDVRSVGDLCAAYQKAFAPEASSPVDPPVFNAGRERAELRRNAQPPRRDPATRTGPEV